ncbi:hypothetical protein F5Y02DRAFT_366724, partial [Annulohypoxylon stygium]
MHQVCTRSAPAILRLSVKYAVHNTYIPRYPSTFPQTTQGYKSPRHLGVLGTLAKPSGNKKSHLHKRQRLASCACRTRPRSISVPAPVPSTSSRSPKSQLSLPPARPATTDLTDHSKPLNHRPPLQQAPGHLVNCQSATATSASASTLPLSTQYLPICQSCSRLKLFYLPCRFLRSTVFPTANRQPSPVPSSSTPFVTLEVTGAGSCHSADTFSILFFFDFLITILFVINICTSTFKVFFY